MILGKHKHLYCYFHSVVPAFLMFNVLFKGSCDPWGVVIELLEPASLPGSCDELVWVWWGRMKRVVKRSAALSV